MTEDLKIKVSLDTSSVKRDVQDLKKTLSNTTSEFGGIDKATGKANQSVSQMTSGMKTLGTASMAQTAVVAYSMTKLQKALSVPKSHIRNLKDELAGVFNFKNFDVDNGVKGYFESMKIQMKEAGVSAKGLAKSLSPLLAAAFKKVSVVAAGVVGAITGLIMGFNHLAESTREYRQAINQVSTSFQSLGSDVKTATATYAAFYRVLGDVQRSTEATNLLAQITTTEKDLVTWTRIATGAMAMFPDSLPTESLIEAANETIKTAKVTGALADALNWPADAANKISKALEGSTEAQSLFNDAISRGLTVEDAFNEVLAQTSNATQREVILRASLNGIYAQSAKLYEENNKALIAQNEAQNRLNQATAMLGNIVQPLQTAFTNFKATLAEALAPAIKVVCDWLVTLVNWLSTAAMWLGAFLAVIFPGAADKISNAFKGASSSIKGATGGTGGLNDGLEKAQGTAEKLRRSLQGFDELNVVTDMTTSGGGSAGVTGGGTTGGGIDVSGLDTGDSVFKTAQEQMEGMKDKIKAFLEEFKLEIGIIAGALGLLGLANLLSHLGQAIGLGQTFLDKMNFIKKLAASAITIVLQYTLVNEFMDSYLDGEGFKNYIFGILTAAIGTGILYKMWGSTGAIIGLSVTAVASIKALLDAEDVTNIQGAVTGLTSLATAVGAVVIAWKSFGTMGATITLVVEAVAALVMGVQDFINKGPTLQNTILIIGGAVAAAVAAATGGLSLVVSAIIGVTVAVGAFTAAILLEKPAIQSVEDAQRALTDAKEAAAAAENSYINAVDAAEASLKKLEEAEKRTGLSGKELFDQVERGTLDYADMTDAQKEVYKAYLDNEKKQKDLKKSTEEYIKTKKAETIASFEHQLSLAKESGSYQDFKESVIDAYESGALSADEARTLIEKSMSEMSNASQKTFMEDIPTDIQEGLNPHRYETTRTKISKWFKEMWTDIKKIFSDAGEWAKSVLNNAWTAITKYWNTHIAPKFTKKYWADKFDTIRAGVDQKLTEAKNTIKNTWDNVKNWFNTNVAPKFTVSYWTNKFNCIKEGGKAAMNGLLGIVEKAINWMVDKLNKFRISIPSWVPEIGGKSFGISLSRVSIPRLAEGGIATRSIFANIGERGREAVLPLDHNTQWMDLLADRIAARSGGAPTKIVLKVGERELGYAVIDAINQNTKQTGGLKLQLV